MLLGHRMIGSASHFLAAVRGTPARLMRPTRDHIDGRTGCIYVHDNGRYQPQWLPVVSCAGFPYDRSWLSRPPSPS